MIKLAHISKYFNKGFSNEVRAVEDLSIDFPQQGLVTLFGHSGSGKTTLLNIVGGLEKPTTGKVYYGDDIIKNFDDIRSKRIGYVFQNYNLFTNLSVFDNVSFVLKMNGITDKDFIKEHVEYALDLVNMLPFARKKATELSGGQQQRVAIARALVKNPDFIIADEPTGNIDSKNKLEVMNILRTIADQKLVILVTHEKHLADYYSDRIISIKDGQIISDESNIPKTSHGFVDDNKIYLKDLSRETINEEDLKVDYYYDKKPKLNVKLIYQNGSLYIHLPTNLKSSIINDDSSIQAVDQSREEIDDSLVETEFRVEDFEIPEEKYTKKQLFSLNSMFKVSFSKLFNQRTRRILLIIGLILSGLLFGVGITQFGAAVKKPVYKDISYDPSFYDLEKKTANPNPDNFKNIFFRSYTFHLEQAYAVKPGYRTDLYTDTIRIAPSGIIKESELMHGTLPKAINEVAITKTQAEEMIKDTHLGILDIKNLVGFNFKYKERNFTITGIVNRTGTNFYFDDLLLKTMFFEQDFNSRLELGVQSLLGRTIAIEEGRMPQQTGLKDELEIVISKSEWDYLNPENLAFQEFYLKRHDIAEESIEHPYKTLTATLKTLKLKVIGVSNDVKAGQYLALPESIIEVYLDTVLSLNRIVVFTDNKELLDQLSNDYIIANMRQSEIKIKDRGRTSKIITTTILSAIIVSLSGIGIYFINKSEMNKQIYQINVYRSLGVKKSHIIKMFAVDVFVVTSLTVLVGYLLFIGLYIRLAGGAFGTFGLLGTNYIVMAGGVVLIYLISFLAGLIPIMLLLRKTPAALMKTYDF